MDLTFGIDLASQPAGTAICLVEWRGDHAAVVALGKGKDRHGRPLSDEVLVEAIAGPRDTIAPAKTAIDAPLGWPVLFAEVIDQQDEWPPVLGGNHRSFCAAQPICSLPV